MADDDVVTLLSSTGTQFQVLVGTAKLMGTLQDLIEDSGVENEVPLPSVSHDALLKLVHFCTVQVDIKRSKPEIKAWNNNFIKGLSKAELCELGIASNYVALEELLDLISEKFASFVKGKSTKNMRKILNVKNDWKKGEEALIRAEYAWHKAIE